MNKTQNKIYENKLNILAIKLIDKCNSYVLDIGCGCGTNAKFLKNNGNIIDGITLSQAEKEVAQEFMRNVFLFNLENGLPIIEHKYDFILCSHVIEHIAYPQNLFRDIKNVMNDDSVLIIAVPNIMQYKNRIKLLLGIFPEQDSGIWDYTHLRWYTIEKMRNLLKENNLKIKQEVFDGNVPFGRLSKFLPKSIYSNILKLLLFLSPSLFSSQLIYAVQKK